MGQKERPSSHWRLIQSIQPQSMPQLLNMELILGRCSRARMEAKAGANVAWPRTPCKHWQLIPEPRRRSTRLSMDTIVSVDCKQGSLRARMVAQAGSQSIMD